MQTSNQPRPWKYMLAGTLAGASGAIGLMLAVTLGLSVGLLWQYAYYRNIVMLNDRATTTMIEDVGRIPAFLWGTRWILLGMAVISIPLARMERFAQRYPPPWRNRIPLTVLLSIIGAVVISGLLTQTDWALYSDIQLGAGSGSRVGYALLQGYPTPLLIIALLVGIGVGAALALAVLTFSSFAEQRLTGTHDRLG